jgi:thioredoxin 1
MRLVEEKDYEELLSNTSNIIVQLSADWCGPCRVLTPILESVAGEKGIEVVKVNIDNNPSIVAKYSVRSIPRVLFIKAGEVITDMTGNQGRQKLEEVCSQVYEC